MKDFKGIFKQERSIYSMIYLGIISFVFIYL